MHPSCDFLASAGYQDRQSAEAAEYLMGITGTTNTTNNPRAHPIPWATLLIHIHEEFAKELSFDNSGFFLLDPTASVLGGPGGMVKDRSIQQLVTGTFQKLAVRQVPGGLAATMVAQRVCLFPRLCLGVTDDLPPARPHTHPEGKVLQLQGAHFPQGIIGKH